MPSFESWGCAVSSYQNEKVCCKGFAQHGQISESLASEGELTKDPLSGAAAAPVLPLTGGENYISQFGCHL